MGVDGGGEDGQHRRGDEDVNVLCYPGGDSIRDCGAAAEEDAGGAEGGGEEGDGGCVGGEGGALGGKEGGEG